MSIELPEAKILAEQMNKELWGKIIKAYYLKDYERLQRIDLLNKDIKSFDASFNDFHLRRQEISKNARALWRRGWDLNPRDP